MAEHYLRKILSLCQERGIVCILETVPTNESSYKGIDPVFLDEFSRWWEEIRADYPTLSINGDLTYYDDALFSDAFHLNAAGTEKYSGAIREKYPEVFQK